MRKNQSTSPYYRYIDSVYHVNAGEGKPIFTHQMGKMIEQLEIMRGHHRKVLVVRFDLHLPSYGHSTDNQVMSMFLNHVRYRVKKRYKMVRLGYAWCRERNQASVQHYHVALLLNGSQIQYPDKLLSLLTQWWGTVSEGGHLYIPENCYYLVSRQSDGRVKRDAIYRLSYLAKVNSKQSREGFANDYGTSRLKMKSDQ
ncbi:MULTISPECIES: YagK/YfjJ domain-containing protein [Vibrio]|uniref:YagK/YfjJ domain-containing protein n=1 Tax=Vibrio TaxID=662 RepID=UPI001592DB9F|nr:MULTISPECIES: inovirus-type Gp2 protein [Vibrio]MCA0770347.1 inovirus Gp2 family protein [Vibrio vulnificus]NVC63554.1 inovirus Gp2 family protein [Vibrio sp. 05-20-BW147]HAS6242246.1 inovirus-type Gp2 protein [Vibrio vulnificus]HDY7944374.1 inovirus-type Gp2 protein [Vibrio vulnificus]